MRSEPTHAEAGLWKHLRRFPVRFRRQAPIGPYVVDFVCHRARLVVEVDGGIHERPDVALRDVERQQWLTSEGYNVMRFTNRQVDERPDEVCAAIRAALPAAFRAEN
jgi:very-short-patch-repair endonuclease